MARPYKISWVYQADEEVLETSIWYLDTFSDDLEPADLTNVSSGVITRIAGTLYEFVGGATMSHAVKVTTPALDGVGPARFINAHGVALAGDGEDITWDRLVVNVALSGENAAEEPVVGGMRLSCVPAGKANRNQFESNWADDFRVALDTVFPQVITDATNDWQRCVKSVRGDADPEYVYPVAMTVSNKVGVNLTRVGNRPQRNTGKEVAP